MFKLSVFCFKIGNGGNAGRQTIYLRKLKGKIELRTCRGTGGEAAVNGVGGAGRVLHFISFNCTFSHTTGSHAKPDSQMCVRKTFSASFVPQPAENKTYLTIHVTHEREKILRAVIRTVLY